MSIQEYRNKMVRILELARANESDMVHEYIEECEAQEGQAYWQQFETIGDMLTDFDLYSEYASKEDYGASDE